MAEDIQIILTDQELSAEHCRKFVSVGSSGGQVMFTGTVRDHTGDRNVHHLEYEAYAPMAIKEMTRIANEAQWRWSLKKVALHHRTGTLSIGELAVVVAVSAPHRAAAFEACQFIIDELKKDVPIWKKEFFEGGEEWISPRP